MTLLVGSIFHMTRKIVSEMTYNVSMGTLNPTIPYHTNNSWPSTLDPCDLWPLIVSEMTYNVSMGTLNPTIPYHTLDPCDLDLWPSNCLYLMTLVMFTSFVGFLELSVIELLTGMEQTVRQTYRVQCGDHFITPCMSVCPWSDIQGAVWRNDIHWNS